MLEELTEEQRHSALGFEMWCCLEDSRTHIPVKMLEMNATWLELLANPSFMTMCDFFADFIELMKMQMVYERELKVYRKYIGQNND
jgi:hypothetical protein